MLPNWVIIGAPKCLTSSLHQWLVDHPEVSGARDKETYYFVDPGNHMFRRESNFREHGLVGYEKLFADADPRAAVVIEATPSYLYSKTALKNLPKLSTRPNFIAVVREPVAQLRSLYFYFQQNWNWIPRDLSFADFISAVEEGRGDFFNNELAANALANAWYPDHLGAWRAVTGSERLHVLVFEDLACNPQATMRDLALKMGIDPEFYRDYDFAAENTSYLARIGVLQDLNIWIRSRLPRGPIYNLARGAYRAINTRRPGPQDRNLLVEQRLQDRFKPMLAELESEFGLDLSRWRSSQHNGGPATRHRVGTAGIQAVEVETAGATRASSPEPKRP